MSNENSRIHDSKTLKSARPRNLPADLSKGKKFLSGIRVIYAYFDKEGKIESVGIYYKGDKENKDRERIVKY